MNPAKPEHQGSRREKYRGALSAAQIADGMNAARRNALRLAADARLLLDADRLPTAAAMAALSIEESGKVSIIRQFSTATGPDAIKQVWKQYNDHRSKNGAWMLYDFFLAGGKCLLDIPSAFDLRRSHI